MSKENETETTKIAEKSGETEPVHKRHGKSEGHVIQFRALVRDVDAGSIIGKRGANIKRLRQEYGATILLPDSESDERILSIEEGTLGTVNDCIFDIIDNLEAYQHYKEKGQTKFICDIHVLIPCSLIGVVLGKAGRFIKAMKETEGSKNLMLFRDPLPNSNECVMWILGTLESVVNIIDKMFMEMKGKPLREETVLFDPDNFPVPNFGGSFNFIDNHRPKERTEKYGAELGGYNQPSYMSAKNNPVQQKDDASDQFKRPDEVAEQKKKKFECTIPGNLIGYIIGQGGDRIKWIRETSKAMVKIGNPDPVSNVAVITMVGTEEQIEEAQYYLLEAAKEALSFQEQQQQQQLRFQNAGSSQLYG